VKKELFALASLKNRLGIALILSAANLVWLGIAPSSQPLAVLLGGEMALAAFLAAWMWAGAAFFASRKARPLDIVFIVTVLAFLIFVLFAAWSGRFFPSTAILQSGSLSRLSAGLLSVLLGAALGLIFSALRELYFLKKTRQPTRYFNIMLACFALAYFSPALAPVAVPFFMSLSVCMLVLNSFRVKWIAFLVKRQKKQLILLSLLSQVIFTANVVRIFDSGTMAAIVHPMSPGLLLIAKIILLYGSCYSGVILFATLFHLPTADAYDRKAEEFASLVDLSQSITGTMEFRDLAEKVTSVTASLCHSDFSWLLIEQNDDFSVPASTNIGNHEARELSLVLLGEIGPDIRMVRTLRDKKLKVRMQNDLLSFSFSSLAIAPLRVKNRTTGYLFMAIKKDAFFEEEDIRTIEAFANSAAIALENARMLETRLEKERLLKELEVARGVQCRLLPQSAPRLSCADIAVYFSPAYEVGGDYYDFFRLDDGCLGFVIADVSGKGLAAAFIMAELKGIFESLAGVIRDPVQLLSRANGALRKSLEKKRFVSASYGLIDPRSRTLRVARAGHMPFFRSSAGRIETHVPLGLVLGAADEPVFGEKLKETLISLKSGDGIVFFTDGISEAKNLIGNEFGYERLKSIIQSNEQAGAEALAGLIMEEVKAFANQPVQYDDITLLVIRIK
jgi:sigma-B regulation protein RsbU (phosphoserine phosphatase)